MPDSLEQLQQQRTDIVRQIGQLGDLRRGSITNTSGRYNRRSQGPRSAVEADENRVGSRTWT